MKAPSRKWKAHSREHKREWCPKPTMASEQGLPGAGLPQGLTALPTYQVIQPPLGQSHHDSTSQRDWPFLNSSLLDWVRGALLCVLMAFITLICVCKCLCWELLEGSTRLSCGTLPCKHSVGPQKDSLDILFRWINKCVEIWRRDLDGCK